MLTALLKFRLDNEQDIFFFSEYDCSRNLIVRLLNVDQNDAYYGEVGDVDLRSQAASLRMTFSDYISSLSKALFQNNVGCEQYTYSIEKSSENFVFKWKRKDEEGTVITLGRMLVNKKDYSISVADILKRVSELLFNLHNKISTLETTLQNNENEKNEALSLLSTAVEAKENLEKEMFAKFTLVLNEKKKRIKELKCKTYSSLPATSCKSKFIKKGKVRNKSSYHDLSDSSGEVDEIGLVKPENITEPGPSNADQNNSFLFLDERNLTLPVTPSKMRNRNISNCAKSYNDQHKSLPVVKTHEPLAMESESDDDLLNNM